MDVQLVALLAVAAVGGVVLFNHVNSRKSLPLPPGPPSIPILGNIHHAPKGGNESAAYWNLGQKYGPVLHFRILDRHIIVLNSREACLTLLEERGARHADRPSYHMALDLINFNTGPSLLRYGADWREQRAVTWQWFRPAAALEHRPIQRAMNAMFLQSLLEDPQDFFPYIRRLAAASILRTTHGFDIDKKHDPFISLADDAMRVFSAVAIPGNFLVDFIPALKHVPAWFPGAGFKNYAKHGKALRNAAMNEPYRRCQEALSSGLARRSMVTALPEKRPESPEYLTVVKRAAASAFLGGSDTTVAAMHGFISLMILNPEKQRTAQAHIDKVTGGERLPTWDDQDALPYIEAVVRETLRLFPVAPLGLPHRALEDDEYQGMLIPKGSLIVANVWSICRNPAMFSDPDVFRPERYLSENGDVDPKSFNPRSLVFGFGRRICPGRYFADAQLWLMIATTLACFNFSSAVDKDGRLRPPSGETDWSGVICGPEHFECRITPRSGHTRALIYDALHGEAVQ